MKKKSLAIILACLFVMVTLLAAHQFLLAARAQSISSISLVSLATNGDQADDASSFPVISANYRYVAFQSWATNLDPLDTSDNDDIYLRDVYARRTILVSRAYDGGQTNGNSYAPTLSADGRYVAFYSYSTNLVPDDNNINCGILEDENCPDVFVYDTQSGKTVLVSISTGGKQSNGWSGNASLSVSGRYIAFESSATNLVANDKDDFIDIFVHDRDADGDGTLDEPGAVNTIRVSISSAGAPANGHSEVSSISANGRFVAFASSADNLVAGDNNASQDIFVHDRDVDGDGVYDEPSQVHTSRVSVASAGAESNGDSYDPAISGDGRFVAFDSVADNLVISDTNQAQDVFLYDRSLDQANSPSTTRLSVSTSGDQADTWSESPAISSDGRFVAFVSPAANLDENCILAAWHVFLRDTQSAQTTCLSLSDQGTEASGDSWNPSISADGGMLVFGSDAEDLVEQDGNLVRDIFLLDRGTSIRTLLLPMVFDQ